MHAIIIFSILMHYHTMTVFMQACRSRQKFRKAKPYELRDIGSQAMRVCSRTSPPIALSEAECRRSKSC